MEQTADRLVKYLDEINKLTAAYADLPEDETTRAIWMESLIDELEDFWWDMYSTEYKDTWLDNDLDPSPINKNLYRQKIHLELLDEYEQDPHNFAWKLKVYGQTETHRLFNEAKFQAGEDAENSDEFVVQKMWDAILDERTRPTHFELDGTVKNLNEDFTTFLGNVAPAPGMFGVPEEDVNCRCILQIYIAEKED